HKNKKRMFMVGTGKGRREVSGFLFFALVVAIGVTVPARPAAARSDDAQVEAASESDADLMYKAMKRSRHESKDDAAIDRALARARSDSERRKQAMRASAGAAWRDPFADPPGTS